MATYTVQAGDSLSKIARDVIGDMARWPELATLNNISPPHTIFPGQVLQLPADTPAPSVVKGAAGKGLPVPAPYEPTPPALFQINWTLVSLAVIGVALIWYGTRK